MKALKKIFFTILYSYIFFAIIYFSLVFYVNDQLEEANLSSKQDIYNNCHKVWATRGLVTEGDLTLTSSGNSIKTINLAFNRGAKGSEVDVYFDPKLGTYVASHDRPYDIQENGKFLTLDELFNSIGNEYYIWLDFKKMGHLSEKEAHQAVERLNLVSNKYGIKNKLYLESEGPINLGIFRDAGFKTIFDTQPLTESYWVSDFVINIYKIAYYFGDFTVMAMNSGSIDDPIFGVSTQHSLKNIPLFLYHVPNNQQHIEDLSRLPDVKVILNVNHSINNYDINQCKVSPIR